jgi:hypothetical protein
MSSPTRMAVVAGNRPVMAGLDPAIPATAVAAVSRSTATALALGYGRINNAPGRLIRGSFRNVQTTTNPPQNSPDTIAPIGLVPEQTQGPP